jgi:adenine-specific DNA-methyltransferase
VPRGKQKTTPKKKEIRVYDHPEATRKNNPPVGLVTPETDPPEKTKTYAYDPHLDPQLVWAGKAERQSFGLPNVSLHVHERIDPRTIIEAVRTKNGRTVQLSLFESLMENPPLRQAIEFYEHQKGWSNRLIAGDSLLVMNSLLEKEGTAGQVQMIYIDPPYGVKYGSNFQPFVNRRQVTDGKDEDLTQEPEMIQAFRDTWELGIHSYLSYLLDRLTLGRSLLSDSGSCFVQISDENVHLVRSLMDEVFGRDQFCAEIFFQKTGSSTDNLIQSVPDILLWYAKDIKQVKFHRLQIEKLTGDLSEDITPWLTESRSGEFRRLTEPELTNPTLRKGLRIFQPGPINSQHPSKDRSGPFEFRGEVFSPPPGRQWTYDPKREMPNLVEAGRIIKYGNTLRGKMFLEDSPYQPLTNIWLDTQKGGFSGGQLYVVETSPKVVQRCLLMTTDPGDLVLDPTCGSGTTAYCAERWGRRWITCDTSRVAIALARQRLMTAVFEYYQLAHPDEGVASGFVYRRFPRITLGSIAKGEPTTQEVLFDQPEIDITRARVSGPFTVEAVPAPVVLSPDRIPGTSSGADMGLVRQGPTRSQAEWRAELLTSGIRGKGGQKIEFSRVEPIGGTRWLHADAESKEKEPRRIVVSFGSEYAPLEQRQVELAWKEARILDPKPAILVFASFQFDPEAAKDIDELTKEKTGMTFLKVQMNADMFTEDLKKKRSSNEGFWLIGQPDIDIHPFQGAKSSGQYVVEVRGFDYYNTKSGTIESGGADRIAIWMLDPDYDGRSLFPRQVFFPMVGEEGGWTRLTRTLKAEVDENLIAAYRGTSSLPFVPGKNRRVAVLIVDDRGIESLRVLDVT